MHDIEHIARISHGKDSLKMLQVIKSRSLPLDRITTTDVWATDTISARLPPVQAFVDEMDQRIWDMYHIEVEHLCARNKDGSKKTYEQMFYHIPVRRSQTVQVERERRAPARLDPRFPRSLEPVVSSWTQTECQATEYRGISQVSRPAESSTTGARSSKYAAWGEIKGWPLSNGKLTWCQHLKTRNIGLFSDSPPRRAKRNIVEYLGIAADEPARFGQLNEYKRAPLVEFGIDEDLCGLYCQYSGMLGPSYETSCRDGCWFCHNQGVDQLRNLWRNWPDLWALLMKWDLDSPVTFKADGHTVHDFDRRFRMEVERKIPTDRTFRWRMLDEPPKFVAYEGEQASFFTGGLI